MNRDEPRRCPEPPTAAQRAWVTCLSAALLFSACGGPSFTGGVFRGGEASYRVGELGPGWEPLSMRQNDLAWRNAELGAIVQVNATCDPFQDVPLTSLVNHLVIGFTEREHVDHTLVPLDGREALRAHVRARLDGVPRELILYVMKKDQCTYDFALVSPGGASFDAAAEQFDRFVTSFTTEVGP